MCIYMIQPLPAKFINELLILILWGTYDLVWSVIDPSIFHKIFFDPGKRGDDFWIKNNCLTFSPLKGKSRLTKPSVWKESMKPEHRQMERDDLKRLQNKAEYKRNPRFVPPLKSGLTKSNRDKKKEKLETEKESK